MSGGDLRWLYISVDYLLLMNMNQSTEKGPKVETHIRYFH